MKNRDGMNGVRFVRLYESISELCRMECHSRNENHHDSSLYSEAGSRAEWRGGIGGLPAYAETLRQGWATGAKKMTETMSNLVQLPAVESVRRRISYGRTGHQLNIQRVFNGSPKPWRKAVRRRSPGGITHVRLLVGLMMHAGRSPSEMFWRGAVACILANVLENAGYRVQIDGYYESSGTYDDGGGSKRTEYGKARWKGNHAERGVDLSEIDRCALLTAHAATMRVAMFAGVLSHDGDANYGLGRCEYGRPTWAPDDEPSIVIDNIWNQSQAVAMLKKAAKGVEDGTLFGSNEY
jgi:hypothetical protein